MLIPLLMSMTAMLWQCHLPRALDGAAFSCGKNSGKRAVDGGRISRD